MAKTKRSVSEISDASDDASVSSEEVKDRSLESSEDELDSGSESEEEQDELDEQDDDEENGEPEQKKAKTEADPNKMTSREQHEQQRKLLKERKLKRNAGVEIEKIKSVWEKLRVKNPPLAKPVREKLCNEIWDLSKECISDLVLKHDSSRVVQTLVKYTTKQRRVAIVEALKTHYFDLARSTYGKYLLVKLLHYGPKESRELIINELHGKFRKLLRHREGAYVAEDLYVLYATQKQRQQMLREFWGSKYAVFKDAAKENDTIKDVVAGNQDARNMIARHLSDTITAAVAKGSTGFQILHAVMRDYVEIANETEFAELVDLLQDQIAELIHTPEGSEVACTLVAKSTAKQRKAIMKNLKPHMKNLLTNQYGHLVMVVIFMTIDDTVMVYKAVSSEFAEDTEQFAELANNKYARKPFLYLLSGVDGKYFNPHVEKQLNKYVEMSAATSKKPMDLRRSELLHKFTPIFYDAIDKHCLKILQENVGLQFVTECVIHAPKEIKLSEKRKAALDRVIEQLQGDLHSETHLMNKPFATRMLKAFIQGGTWNFKEQSVDSDNSEFIGTEFSLRIVNEVFNESDIEEWVKSKNGPFLIASVYEKLKNEPEAKKFIGNIGKFKKLLKNEKDENKGAKFLLKVIS